MKKLQIVVTAAAVLLTAFAAWRLAKVSFAPAYLSVIRMNWGVSLPENCREIYETDSGASFHGDGERYHVFQYHADVLSSLPVSKGAVPEKDRENIEKILSALQVEKKYCPGFAAMTGEGSRDKYGDGSDRVYFLYDGSTKILYVAESFL